MATAADNDASTPELIGGRDRLGPLLGQGGSGRVYQATDRSLGRPVAVKVLYDEASAERAARFEREISLQAGLAHASLIPLLDAGLDGGRRYDAGHPVIHGARHGARTLISAVRLG